MGCRTVASALVYEKTYELSNSAWQQRSIGEIQNLMALDAKVLAENMHLLPQLISAPLFIVMLLAILGNVIGPTMLMGVLVMVLSVPVSGKAFGHIVKSRIVQSSITDQRLKKISGLVEIQHPVSPPSSLRVCIHMYGSFIFRSQ